jgi:hypothetical protein
VGHDDAQYAASTAPPLSVEERLRHVRECCRLLSDVFAIQAEATFLGAEISLSEDAYNALTTICRGCADDLQRLVREIPPSLANWVAESDINHVQGTSI